MICCIRSAAVKARQQQQALVLHAGQKAVVTTASGSQQEYMPSAQLARRMASKWPRPDWHAPWKMYRVISGHLGCARSLPQRSPSTFSSPQPQSQRKPRETDLTLLPILLRPWQEANHSPLDAATPNIAFCRVSLFVNGCLCWRGWDRGGRGTAACPPSFGAQALPLAGTCDRRAACPCLLQHNC